MGYSKLLQYISYRGEYVLIMNDAIVLTDKNTYYRCDRGCWHNKQGDM